MTEGRRPHGVQAFWWKLGPKEVPQRKVELPQKARCWTDFSEHSCLGMDGILIYMHTHLRMNMHVCMHECMHACMCGWMHVWMDGWM